jgi:hypothetical protein
LCQQRSRCRMRLRPEAETIANSLSEVLNLLVRRFPAAVQRFQAFVKRRLQ